MTTCRGRIITTTCYFLGEYTARQGYAYSATNGLIINLKKSVDRRGKPEWTHKERAILQVAAALRNSINDGWFNNATLIPIPPSKAKSHPLYDDRLMQVLRAIRPQPPLDIRELIIQNTSTDATHHSDTRPRPETLESLYALDHGLTTPVPQVIGLFDDVLTTGCHFKAAQSLLHKAFPEVHVIGLFIARRVPEAMDIEDVFGFRDK